MGLFCTVVPSQAKDFDIETLATARPVETDRADKAVSVLLAHVVSTRSCSDVVTDNDMDYPRDWRERGGRSAAVGHQEAGRTLAMHSLAVSPRLQGCGLGKMILKSYLQQMNNSGTADRVALICQDVSDHPPSFFIFARACQLGSHCIAPVSRLVLRAVRLQMQA